MNAGGVDKACKSYVSVRSTDRRRARNKRGITQKKRIHFFILRESALSQRNSAANALHWQVADGLVTRG